MNKDLGRRMQNVDFFRVLAILLVTLFHIIRNYKVEVMGINILQIFNQGYIGVDLFFFISGYCMFSSLESLKNRDVPLKMKLYYFYLLRISRILIPYYICIVVWNFLVRFGVAPKNAGVWDNIAHILFVHNFFEETFFSISGVFWSIATEVQFYLIIPFVYFQKKIKITWVTILLLPISIYLWSASSRIFSWSVIAFLPLFLLGLICRTYLDKLKKPSNLFRLFLISTFLLLNYSPDLYPMLKRILLGAVLGILMISYTNMELPPQINKFVHIAAKYSYSIYLYNYIFYALPLRGMSLFSKVIISTIFVFIIGILLGWLFENKLNNRILHSARKKVYS